jgi:PLP dependent protein
MTGQIATRWHQLQDQIAHHAHLSGRDPSQITTIAVTKGRPLSALLELAKAGCHHIGENRIQEAASKKPQAPPFTWHLIGTLQSNKLAKALSLFDMIHSVDRLTLALPPTYPILLQVNVSNEPSKHGFSPAALLDQFPLLPPLNIQGLMTIASATATPSQLSAQFATLRCLRDSLATTDRPLPHLSMGMSRDYPIAIAEGATLLRIGSLLFE